MSKLALPSGVSEEALHAAVTKASTILGPRFAFGSWTAEDLGQEIWAWTIKSLSSYDPAVGPLENFVFSNARNRLINLRRNRLSRTDAPCRGCRAAACGQGQPPHEDGELCARYRQWWKRQQAKRNLACTLPFEETAEKRQNQAPGSADDVEARDLVEYVGERLEHGLRRYWLMMREGVFVYKQLRRQVEDAVLDILAEAGLGPEDLGLRPAEQGAEDMDEEEGA